MKFIYGDIDEYRDLNGRYNTANGATDDFDIDSGQKKVNIGWTNAYVSTVRGGTLALSASIRHREMKLVAINNRIAKILHSRVCG